MYTNTFPNRKKQVLHQTIEHKKARVRKDIANSIRKEGGKGVVLKKNVENACTVTEEAIKVL